MKQYLKIEMRRCFCNIYFVISISVAIGICIWHFLENVWGIRMYIACGSYPLSVFSKWIGGDNASVQQTLYYILIPILCAVSYGKSFYNDIKTGFIAQLVTRKSRDNYMTAKYVTAFISGAVISVAPLIFDFLLTGAILPAVIPQRGLGLFPITSTSVLADLYYQSPFLYTIVFLFFNALFFGGINTATIWAAKMVTNGFWIILMPFLIYTFMFCILQFVGEERFAPLLFLRLSQPIRSELEVIILELMVLVLISAVTFIIWC